MNKFDRLYDVVDEYLSEHKIHYSSTNTYLMEYRFYEKEDALNLLKFLWKYHRDLYYYLDSYLKPVNNKLVKRNDFNGKIFVNYDNIGYIKNYSIMWRM